MIGECKGEDNFSYNREGGIMARHEAFSGVGRREGRVMG